MNLSEKLITLRKKRGMSQEELAVKLGVTRQSVSRWEMGSALPDAHNLRALSCLFGVSADTLLDDDADIGQDADNASVAPVHATPKQIKITVYEASPKKAAIYNILTTLPIFFTVSCIDKSPSVMLMCWICSLLSCFSRVFNAKTASFSQTPEHIRKRHFLGHTVMQSALCAFTVILFFSYYSDLSEIPLNAVLCLFLLQLYMIFSMEVSLYTPGDKSDILRKFRTDFYCIAMWLCIPAPTVLLSCAVCKICGFDELRKSAVLTVFILLLSLCSLIFLILRRKREKR